MSKTNEEIHASAQALEQTVQRVDDCLKTLTQRLGAHAFERCVMIGSGSSFSIGKSLANIARMAFGGAACALSAGDVALRGEAYRKVCDGALIVILSRSGETSELGFALKALRKAGATFRVLGIYCAEGSTLARESDFSIEIPWAFDYSVCQTRSVTSMFTAGAYLLARLSGQEDDALSIRKAIEGLPAFVKTQEPRLAELAKKPFAQVVVLGDAELAGLCEEGSLAFKEICQIPSNFYHLLDCRHGPMVLFDANTLVIAVDTGENNTLEHALLADVVGKGCLSVVCSDLPLDLPGMENISFGTKLRRIARGIPMILVCQLLSYYASCERGTDPDSPTGLDACIRL